MASSAPVDLVLPERKPVAVGARAVCLDERASERAGYYHRQGNGGGIVKDKASVVVRAEESAGRRCV